MTVRFSALRGGRPLSPGRFVVLISVRGWVNSRVMVQLEELYQLKYSNDLIGNRTGDLPACSIVPQPTTLPCAPVYMNVKIKFERYKMPKKYQLGGLLCQFCQWNWSRSWAVVSSLGILRNKVENPLRYLLVWTIVHNGVSFLFGLNASYIIWKRILEITSASSSIVRRVDLSAWKTDTIPVHISAQWETRKPSARRQAAEPSGYIMLPGQ
jgi:hypothetical protein